MIALLLALASAQGIVAVAERPDPLEPEPGCERWTGIASGNDPSVQFDVVLCGEDAVTGQVVWSSEVSGWNRRIVEGSWSEDHNRLILHDVEMAEERPSGWWRFCEITEYDMTAVSATELSGRYSAPDCDDEATFRLTRAGDALAPIAPPSPVAPAPSPIGCTGCAWTSAFPMGAGLWLVVLGIRRRQ